MGCLYVVAGPIGNLGDCSTRAGQVLASVDLILAEDTRITKRLLDHLNVSAKLLSYNEHNHRQRLPAAIAALSTGDVALVSDAGTPSISDPGTRMVDEAWHAGFEVTTVPGPSAVIAALSVSGFNVSPFEFIGFWPRSSTGASKMIEALAVSATTVAFEGPSRLAGTLRTLGEHLPERRLLIARELTKLHEEVQRGRCGELAAKLAERTWRGEITIVIEGASMPTGRDVGANESPDEAELKERARRISRHTGVSRRDVRRVLLALRNNDNI